MGLFPFRSASGGVMASLDEILALEAEKKAELLENEYIDFDPLQFGPAQLGMRSVMADAKGRLWDVSSRPWKMLYCPHGLMRIR